MNGLRAFREGYLNADVQLTQRQLGEFDEWSRWEARQARYSLFWGLYQNNAYREGSNPTAKDVRDIFNLYRRTRGVVNPVHRMVEFHATHLVGGSLDRKAGNGEKVKTCLPIETDREAIRPALGKLWRDSKLAVEKGVIGRYGPCLGDVPIRIVDDPQRRRPTLKVEHPGHVKWVERDSSGRIIGYLYEQARFDPRHTDFKTLNPLTDPRSRHYVVIYSEECWTEGGRVRYRTYLNGALWDWRGQSNDGGELPPEWDVPYSYVPMVIIPHLPIGLDWGMAEPHALVAKAFEGDDQASGLGDQIRKVIRSPKLITGVAKIADITRPPDQDDRDRQSVTIFTTPKSDANVHDLATQLDIPGVGAHIDRIVAEMERDFPELRYDLQNINGEASGRALRTARDAITTKIQERRTTYDAGLVEAFQIALAIGGARGYPGYEEFAGVDDPHEDKRLDMAIGHRPVFSPDPLDDSEEFLAEWQAIGAAVQQSGAPLEWVLRQRGYEEEQIADLKAVIADQQSQQLADTRARMAAAGADTQDLGGDGADASTEKGAA